MTRNAAQTQQRLIDTAAEMIAEQGIAGLRVDELAKRARVNKRMIYHYFGSKHGLWLQVLSQYGEHLCVAAAELSDKSRDFLRTELAVNSQRLKSHKNTSITTLALRRAAKVVLRRFLDGPEVVSVLEDADWRNLYLTLCRLAFSKSSTARIIEVSKDLPTPDSKQRSALLNTKPRYQLRPRFRSEI